MPACHGLVVLSIDGVPHGLLLKLMADGVMPAFARLCEQNGPPRMMRSVFPTVSCVAWACYATGRNPGKHGIFGFIDRKAGTNDLIFPNAATMRGPNIWELLSREGKSVFGMNVPGTYPPRPVNGTLIGGFLAPSVEKVAYPPETGEYLKSIDYRIDSDAQLARESKEKMLGDLDLTLASRAEAMLHFLARQQWDFFHTHIMGTDRINHFLFARFQQGDSRFAPAFREYYRKVDGVIGRLAEAIGPDTPLMILSDHGFCPIRYEVQLARYLIEKGWTAPAEKLISPLSFKPGRTRAFTLIPGRIYVNLRGREAGGCVPVEDYEQVRQAVTADLLAFRDPDNHPVIRTVLKREELYWPTGKGRPDPADASPIGLPPYSMGPDLVAIPHDGYDLKMGLNSAEIFVNTELEGMHTAHDALCFARGVALPEENFEIRRLGGVIMETVGVTPPEELDVESVPAPVGAL